MFHLSWEAERLSEIVRTDENYIDAFNV